MGDWEPQPLPAGTGFDEGQARARVAPPAVFMMVVAGISITVALVVLVFRVLGVSMGSLAPSAAQPNERVASLLFGGLGIAFGLISIAVNVFVVFAALKMRNLEQHVLAVIAAILTMLPSSFWFCCCLGINLLPGLAAGIWALVVLFDQNVKAAFRS
jgi:hypothetical protein